MFKKFFMLGVVLFLIAFSGCINIDQEIFLKTDGSGEYLIHMTMPNIEDKKKDEKKEGAESAWGMEKNPTKDLKTDLESFQKEMSENLPAGIKIKEVKTFPKNGLLHFYAIFTFNSIDALQKFYNQQAKGEEKDKQKGKGNKKDLEKIEEKNIFTTAVDFTKVFLKKNEKGNLVFHQISKMDLSEALKEKGGKESTPPEKTDKSKKNKKEEETQPLVNNSFEESMQQIMDLVLGGFKMRFIVHTPTSIVSTNSDFVTEDKTALWDYSFNYFAKKGGNKVDLTVEFKPE